MPLVCEAAGCQKYPSYNTPETTIRLYCASHKKPGMVNVAALRCLEPGCKVIPSFGRPNGPTNHCAAHFKAGEINLVSVRCVTPGCKTIAAYGASGSKHRRYCVRHKSPGMVHLTNHKRKKARPSKRKAGGEAAAAAAAPARQEKRSNTANA